jgi:transposase
MNQQTKLKDLETSVLKNVTEGGLVASTCDVVIPVFYAFFASCRCLSSVVIVPRAFVGSLGSPTPAKKIVAFCHATHLKKKISFLYKFLWGRRPRALPYEPPVIVSEYLDEVGTASVQWPGRSPDLNPIEDWWDMMGRRVRALQPSPATLAELGEQINRCLGQSGPSRYPVHCGNYLWNKLSNFKMNDIFVKR